MKERDIDRIDQFIRNELSVEDRLAFEQELQTNEELAKELAVRQLLVDGIKHHHRIRLKSIFVEEEEKFNNETETEKSFSAKIRKLQPSTWILAAAAMVVLLLLYRFAFLSSSPQPQDLFASNVEHFSAGDFIQRGNEGCESLAEAATIYDQRQYVQAIPAFEQLMRDTTALAECNIKLDELQLFLGISYLFEDQYDEARPLLNQLKGSMEIARWFYILSFVKAGEYDEVVRQIDYWENPSNYYKRRLDRLREELE